MKRVVTGSLLALVLAVPACRGSDQACAASLPAVAPVSAALPAEIVPVAGVEELYDLVDVVVDGTITNVADGRVVGGSKQFHHVVVTVTPAKVFKAPNDEFPDAVHVEFQRAVNDPAAEFRDVIPDGTRIVLFGYLRPEEKGEPVRNQFAGRAAGSLLYAAAPQGLFLGMDHSVLRGRVTLGIDQGMDGFTDLQAFAELPRPASVAPTPTTSISPSPACN